MDDSTEPCDNGPMPRSRVVSLDKEFVWRPYTDMSAYMAGGDPLVIDRGEGIYLYDADGTRYLDACSSWWTASLGHQHPRLVKALVDQAGKLCHVAFAGVAHEQASALARALVEVAPRGLTRAFFTDNGSTSVEVAIKMAVQMWRQLGHPEKHRFVTIDGAFHGETIGATSLGGVEVFRRPFGEVLFDCIVVPSPADGGYARAFQELSRVLREDADSIAGVFIEPLVQGAAGMRTYATEYLRELRSMCTRHDVLLVADEVFTGYGRTGTMWACDQAGITPDLMCLGKTFASLLPMGATLATERVFSAFGGGRDRALLYGHTFCANPLGARVALEVLKIIDEEQIVSRTQALAPLLATRVDAIAAMKGVVGTRSLGLIGAVDLAEEGSTLGDERESYLRTIGWKVADEARKRGVYLRPLGSTVYVCPPLIILEAELVWLLDQFSASIEAALSL
jgi:adenosylmethionine-8-amino-7-oxononanoate aminotransferase